LTNEAVGLIVPDKQLLRLGYTKSDVSESHGVEHAVKLIVPDKQLILPVSSPEILIPKRRGRLFFFDETNICWCPDTGRIYHTVGEQVKIDSPGENETKYILGSLEYPTGVSHWRRTI
jgi:hypothetical protein